MVILLILGLTSPTPLHAVYSSSNKALTASIVDIIASDKNTPEVRRGQGIIIDTSGVIVTNRHVIGDAPKSIHVCLINGHSYQARVLYLSQNNDLAFIKIASQESIKALRLGDSSGLTVGNKIMAYGNVFLNQEPQQTGTIIQIYREAESNSIAILEIDLRLNPGDSGGPITNNQGRLLGIILANQISDHNKSFAITVNKIEEEYLRYKHASFMTHL